jgi:hypothetical protein
MVVTLVNIFVKVFHSRDGAANLNIDVALVPHGQVGVVRDDPMVVKDKTRAARRRGQQQKVVSHLGVVATLALGSRPRQRGCKGAGQREARESHQGLPGV